MWKPIFEKYFDSYEELEDFLNTDDVKRLIGKNYDKYKNLFLYKYRNTILNQPKEKVKGNINWPAILALPFWAAYRKIYSVSAIIAIILSIIVFIEIYFNLNEINIGIGILACSFFANAMYFDHIVKVIKKNLRN